MILVALPYICMTYDYYFFLMSYPCGVTLCHMCILCLHYIYCKQIRNLWGSIQEFLHEHHTSWNMRVDLHGNALSQWSLFDVSFWISILVQKFFYACSNIVTSCVSVLVHTVMNMIMKDFGNIYTVLRMHLNHSSICSSKYDCRRSRWSIYITCPQALESAQDRVKWFWWRLMQEASSYLLRFAQYSITHCIRIFITVFDKFCYAIFR
jgi:hypothetical protein